jgi:putative inorganic carbon (HCO3(-)) transporter
MWQHINQYSQPFPKAAPQPIPASSTDVASDDYPLSFWFLVFFTFIAFVAPQNNYAALQPFYLAKTAGIVALIAFALQRFSRGQSILPTGTEFRLLGAMVGWAVLSLPFSNWVGGSVDVLTDLFAKSLAICFLMAHVLTSVKRFKQMLWFMVLCCLCISLVAWDGYRLGIRVEGYRMAGGWAGLSANPNDFALTINMMLPFAVAYLLLTKNVLHKGVVAAFLVISVSAIVLTYSRTGFLTLASIMGLAMLKMAGHGRGFKYILPVGLVIFVFLSQIPQDYGGRLESIVETDKDRLGSASARLAGIHAAWDVVQEHPIFGVGLGMNTLALNTKGLYWAHVHNVYLQLAAEIGVPGLIFYVLLVAQLLRGLRQIEARFQRDLRHHEIYVLATACEVTLLAYCIAAFFHPVAYNFYFYYIAGFALALKGIAARIPAETPQPAPAPRAMWGQAQGFRIPAGV